MVGTLRDEIFSGHPEFATTGDQNLIAEHFVSILNALLFKERRTMNISRQVIGKISDWFDRFNSNNSAPPRLPREVYGGQPALAYLVGEIKDSGGYLQQDVQAEARELIAAHTHYLGTNLDEVGLGAELARRVGERTELVRAVYVQLSPGNKVEVARAMVGAMSDDKLRDVRWSEGGLELLHDINRWVANNSLTGDGQANVAGDRRLRERIGVALTRRDDITEITTRQVQGAQPERGRGAQQIYPPRYTAEDVRRLFGQNSSYTRLDDWVNIVARGEGSFTDAAILRDRAGLSVGIRQWTQNSGRLGELMQRYRDVAEREDRLAEFHQVFGGRENAEQLLSTLRDNPARVRPADIQVVFREAGRRDVFQRAQIEKAREEMPDEMRGIAQDHPYSRDGAVSSQSMATSLIVHNIGPQRRDNVYRQTISGLYDELMQQRPNLSEQVRGRQVTDDMKREIVTANVSEQEFNNRLASVAPRVLYTTPANYRAHARGLEIRLRQAIDMFPPEERVNPDRL